MNFFKIISIILLGMTLTACKNPFNSLDADLCWSDATKASTLEIVKKSVDQHLVSSLKKDRILSGYDWTESDTERTKKLLNYKLNNFFVRSVSSDGNSVNCGTKVSITLKASNEKQFNTTSIIGFELYKAENEQYITTISGQELGRLKLDLESELE